MVSQKMTNNYKEIGQDIFQSMMSLMGYESPWVIPAKKILS